MPRSQQVTARLGSWLQQLCSPLLQPDHLTPQLRLTRISHLYPTVLPLGACHSLWSFSNVGATVRNSIPSLAYRASPQHIAMDVVGSVIAVLQLSAVVLGYLNSVKNYSEECKHCTIEALNNHSLLTNLRFILESNKAYPEWIASLRFLTVQNGPLDQFQQALETLQAKLTNGGRLKKMSGALVWKFKREEVRDIVCRMDRLKSLVTIALEMDHL